MFSGVVILTVMRSSPISPSLAKRAGSRLATILIVLADAFRPDALVCCDDGEDIASRVSSKTHVAAVRSLKTMVFFIRLSA
jgi:hypothetical protein